MEMSREQRRLGLTERVPKPQVPYPSVDSAPLDRSYAM